MIIYAFFGAMLLLVFIISFSLLACGVLGYIESVKELGGRDSGIWLFSCFMGLVGVCSSFYVICIIWWEEGHLCPFKSEGVSLEVSTPHNTTNKRSYYGFIKREKRSKKNHDRVRFI